MLQTHVYKIILNQNKISPGYKFIVPFIAHPNWKEVYEPDPKCQEPIQEEKYRSHYRRQCRWSHRVSTTKDIEIIIHAKMSFTFQHLQVTNLFGGWGGVAFLKF